MISIPENQLTATAIEPTRLRRHERRIVTGLMPHPERACEPLLGSDDGKWIFESIFAALKNKPVAAAA